MPEPDRTVPPLQRQEEPFATRPVFLSGRVLMQDGGAPPESVVIESVCDGRPRAEAYTNSKGNFSFQLGSKNSGVFQDASIGSERDYGLDSRQQTGMSSMGGFGAAERMLMGCEIQAKLPGYRSQVISLANRKPMDNPDIGIIYLQKLGAPVEGRLVSLTTLAAPKDARKAFEKGQEAVGKKKAEDALKNFRKAVDLYPQYAAAWCELARVQAAQQQMDEARRSLDFAIKADPKFIDPYLLLATIQASAKEWENLRATTEQVIQLDPYDYPQAYFMNGVAHYNLRNVEAAEKSVREAQRLDTRKRFPKSWHLLGAILAARRDYPGAAEQMRDYLKFAPQASDATTVQNQITELERLAGGAPRQ